MLDAERDPKPQMFDPGFGAQGAVGDPKPQMFNQGLVRLDCLEQGGAPSTPKSSAKESEGAELTARTEENFQLVAAPALPPMLALASTETFTSTLALTAAFAASVVQMKALPLEVIASSKF